MHGGSYESSLFSRRPDTLRSNWVLNTYRTNRHRITSRVCFIVMSQGVAIACRMGDMCRQRLQPVLNQQCTLSPRSTKRGYVEGSVLTNINRVYVCSPRTQESGSQHAAARQTSASATTPRGSPHLAHQSPSPSHYFERVLLSGLQGRGSRIGHRRCVWRTMSIISGFTIYGTKHTPILFALGCIFPVNQTKHDLVCCTQ